MVIFTFKCIGTCLPDAIARDEALMDALVWLPFLFCYCGTNLQVIHTFCGEFLCRWSSSQLVDPLFFLY